MKINAEDKFLWTKETIFALISTQHSRCIEVLNTLKTSKKIYFPNMDFCINVDICGAFVSIIAIHKNLARVGM